MPFGVRKSKGFGLGVGKRPGVGDGARAIPAHLGEEWAAGWSLDHSCSLISAPLPPAPGEIMFPWG